jgi:ABC-type glycerol-3-phosphate transport system permease component
VMMPVNVWLFMIPPGTALSPLRKLMRDWGLLEWGHVLIGFAAACVFAWALELPL